MIDMISYFIQNLTLQDVKNFALKNNIYLSDSEVNFTYEYIKNNYSTVLKDPNSFDFSQYQKHYTKENYEKINHLIKVYINYL